MRISLNEIKKLVPAAAQIDTDELIKLIGSRLVEVEEKIDLAPKYAGIYVVKVLSADPIPETHLHLCQIDTGEAPVQVVCGAPNVHAGMHAVWIAPGSIVPQTYGGENFKLDVRKLRGYESHGMLAGLDELDLGDDHSGIVEIDPAIAPGTPFAEAFDLNDIILDIENKSLTHRPDCFGLIGFAREVSGILGAPFGSETSEMLFSPTSVSEAADVFSKAACETGEMLFSPTSAVTTRTGESARNDGPDERFGEKSHSPVSLSIAIEDATLCPRYSCAVLEMSDALTDDKYLTSTDIFLAKAGMHGISKIVDVTNYLMLMTGQPLHAFDYDKFVKVGGAQGQSAEPKIIIRVAKDGEELELLDGKTIKCNSNDILITSNNKPVALAGAMGGKNTEIDASTKKVLLESATFSLYNLRKTQMAHGIFSEAITRFTKGQPASQTLSVLEKACDLLDAKVEAIADSYPNPTAPVTIQISSEEINSLLGTSYDTPLITKTLTNVGFEVKNDGSSLNITSPTWRTDIHIKEDLIEEVGRLLGYDNIPLDLPLRPFTAVEQNPLLTLKSQLRDILSGRLTAHELLTYSFVSRKLQETVGENPEDSYKITNSLSPELQCFRQTLTPSLLEKFQINLKAGYKDAVLYEFNQVTKKSLGQDEDGVPVLKNHLALVTPGDYYKVKSLLAALLGELGLAPEFVALGGKDHLPACSYLEPLHSAAVLPSQDLPTPVAFLGEIKPTVLKRLKLSAPVSAFELDLEALQAYLPKAKATTKTAVKTATISKFPAVERDLTLKVATTESYAETTAAILRIFQAKGLNIELSPASIYQAQVDTNTKNLSFHLRFSSPNKTLTSSEISDIMEEVTKSVKAAVGAEVV